MRHDLSDPASAAVRAIAARLGVTPFTVHLVAMHTVLTRGGAGPANAVGVVVANRISRREQGSVGYHANLVVLPCRVTDTDIFDEVVGWSRDALWENLPHQHVAFADVFAALPDDDRRSLGSTPPVLLTHHGQIGSGLRLGGRPSRLLPSPSTTAGTQLLIGLFDDGTRTVVEVEYDTGRYDESTARALLADLEEVLVRSAEPGVPVGMLRVRSRTVAGFRTRRRVPSTDRSDTTAAGVDELDCDHYRLLREPAVAPLVTALVARLRAHAGADRHRESVR